MRWKVLLIIASFLGPPLTHPQSESWERRALPQQDTAMRSDQEPWAVSRFQSNVDVVLVPVTVTDSLNRCVLGMHKENFAVQDDKREQQIRYFSQEDAPLSVGLIVDMSSSMARKLERLQEAVNTFLADSNAEDQFFLLTFSDQLRLRSDWTRSISDIQSSMVNEVPFGNTALLDAIYFGVRKERESVGGRKVLLVISDGGDNRSRHVAKEIKRAVMESDVQVYAIGLFSEMPVSFEEASGPALLSGLSKVSGGRLFQVDDENQLPDVTDKIGRLLREQYVLGYVPDRAEQGGIWHKITVKLRSPVGSSQLRVSFKRGYYSEKR